MSRQSLSAAIYAQLDSLLGDAEHGELDAPPHCRLVLLRDGTVIADALDDTELDEADLSYLENEATGGIIVTELQNGTYSVRYYPDEDALDDAWGDLCSDLDGGVTPATLRSLSVADEGDDEVVPNEDDDLDEDEEE